MLADDSKCSPCQQFTFISLFLYLEPLPPINPRMAKYNYAKILYYAIQCHSKLVDGQDKTDSDIKRRSKNWRKMFFITYNTFAKVLSLNKCFLALILKM